MNTPNKLTVFRIALVPLIVFFLMYRNLDHRYLYALLVFVIASFTDRLDGQIARKTKSVTNFGAIMDPLADKILVSSILICLTDLWLIPALAVLLIIGREFIVTSIRFLILENEHKVISANIWGKLKTVSQMITIFTILVFQVYIEESNRLIISVQTLTNIQNILVWICVLLSVMSGLIYILDNRRYIKAD